MARKYNLTAIVCFTTIIEGLAIYIDMVVHPTLQPALTIIIITMATIANGLVVWYFSKIRPDLLKKLA